jgi:two-component system sensor histidine kinase AgrC
MLENSTQFSIFYSANIDCIAIFMSLMAFYYLNELSFLNNSVQFNIYDLVLIILINIILFIFMFILSYNFFINNLNYYLGLLILGFLLLSIIIVVSLNYCYILKRKEDINISMYKAQQLDKAYYQGLEIENEDLRKLKHDYKNHLLNLKQLIAYQNTEASLQYINKLINTNVTSKMNRFCNISYIDSYLNSIIESNNNINFDIHSTDLSQLSNMGFDILIILMNLIDNALENTSNNTINVDIVYNHDIIIKICNHSIKNPIKSHFKSSKGENHGLGLKIVNDIVMKYNGEAYDNYEKTLYSKYIILKTGAKTNEEINI